MSEENRYDDERRHDESEERRGREERREDRDERREDREERRDSNDEMRENGNGDGRRIFNFDPSMRGNGVSILVKNLNYRTDREKLAEIFSEFGDLSDVYIPLDYNTREPRGFAFCEYVREDDALSAISAMDGQMIDEFTVTVARAERQRKRPEDYRRRDRYGGRSRYDDRRGGGRGYDRYDRGSRYGGRGYDRYDDRDSRRGDRYGRDDYDRDRRGGSRDRGDDYRGGRNYSPPRDRGSSRDRDRSRNRDSSYDRYR